MLWSNSMSKSNYCSIVFPWSGGEPKSDTGTVLSACYDNCRLKEYLSPACTLHQAVHKLAGPYISGHCPF